MRPRGMRSKWVKVLPWYYTERRQPTRQEEEREAIEFDLKADMEALRKGHIRCEMSKCENPAATVEAVDGGDLYVCSDHHAVDEYDGRMIVGFEDAIREVE